MTISSVLAVGLVLASVSVVIGAQSPAPPPDVHRKFFALGDFHLESGVVLPKANTADNDFINAQVKGFLSR